jgi:hypothetical protein
MMEVINGYCRKVFTENIIMVHLTSKSIYSHLHNEEYSSGCGGSRGCDRVVVRFTTTCAISAYHYLSCEFETHLLARCTQYIMR